MTTTFDSNDSTKRKRGDKVFRFKNFGDPGHPVTLDGSFIDNIKSILQFGDVENYPLFKDVANTWTFRLEVHRNPPIKIYLLVFQEAAGPAREHWCKYCRYVGWESNTMCNESYHFVATSKHAREAVWRFGGYSTKRLDEALACEADQMMHGVFHSNGSGHLLCLNGMEMGSEISGHEMMNFWDRLCARLRARQVSIRDTSRKRGIELRLLHAIANGETWFGRWGYKFSRGAFGVTKPMYHSSIEAMQRMPLPQLVAHVAMPTISKYQAISDHPIINLRDIFHFLLDLKRRLPREAPLLASTNDAFCRWSTKRVEMATRVVMEELRTAATQWVTRQEIRDAARIHVGDTGLLDFVLKTLGNQVVGNVLVRRSLNPVTKVLEYCLLQIRNPPFGTNECSITRTQLENDIDFIYKSIVKVPVWETARRIVLDAKFLVKEYDELSNLMGAGEIVDSDVVKTVMEEDRRIDCGCGTYDDDGERMVCCDVCNVWQHSRCLGISEDEEIPHIFLCNSCETNISLLPPMPEHIFGY